MKKFLIISTVLFSVFLYGCSKTTENTSNSNDKPQISVETQELGNEKFGTVQMPKSEWETLRGEKDYDKFGLYYDNTNEAVFELGFGADVNVKTEDKASIIATKTELYTETFGSKDFKATENVDFFGFDATEISGTYKEPLKDAQYQFIGWIFNDKNGNPHYVTVESKPEKFQTYVDAIKESYKLEVK